MDKQTILTAALELAKTRGYDNVYKRHVSTVLGIGMGTVNFHWGTMDALRIGIVHEAIRTGERAVVMQAASRRDPVLWLKRLSPSLRDQLAALNIAL